MIDAIQFTQFVAEATKLKIESGSTHEDAMCAAQDMTEAWVAVFVDGGYNRLFGLPATPSYCQSCGASGRVCVLESSGQCCTGCTHGADAL